MLRLVYEEIAGLNIPFEFPYMRNPPGDEHYRILATLAAQVTNNNKRTRPEYVTKILDVGTFRGYSALALAYGAPDAIVKSYNLVDEVDPAILELDLKSYPDFIVDDVLLHKPEEADLILLDTYHSGDFERLFLDHLRANNFGGILILDDINLSDVMRAVWEEITEPKIDVTNLGHYTGTGLVFFNSKVRGRITNADGNIYNLFFTPEPERPELN